MRARTLLIAVGVGLLAASAASALNAYLRYRAYRPDGDESWLWDVLLLFTVVLLLAATVLLASLVCLLLRRLRTAGVVGLLLATSFVIGYTVLPTGDSFRTRGMRTIISNGRPVIAVVRAYHKDHSTWPPSLSSLVPAYLPAVPHTGLAAFPAYEYVVGPDAVNGYHGNPWVLRVPTPSGGINWDQLIFYPLKNYPGVGHSGYLEPIEDWAYVHE